MSIVMRSFVNTQNDGIKKMGNLKFLIFALGLVVTQGAKAVTLPSQSYQEYSIDPMMADESMYNGSIGYGVSMPSESYSSLRAGEGDWGRACVQSSSRDILTCQNCCSSMLDKVCSNLSTCPEEYLILYHNCANECGRSLPLEGGIYLLLALAVAFGAAKAAMFHKRDDVELTLHCCGA